MSARQIIEAEMPLPPAAPRTLKMSPVRNKPRGHNTPLANLEFQLTWTETNLRYLLGAPAHEREEGLITQTQAAIAEIEAEIERLRSLTPAEQAAEQEIEQEGSATRDPHAHFTNYWVNQPSTLQPGHRYHGQNVRAPYGRDKERTVQLADGSSVVLSRMALALGHRS